MKIGSTAPNTREEITKPRNPCPQPDDPDANTAHHAPECKGTPGPQNKQTKKLQHANRTCGRAPPRKHSQPPVRPSPHTRSTPTTPSNRNTGTNPTTRHTEQTRKLDGEMLPPAPHSPIQPKQSAQPQTHLGSSIPRLISEKKDEILEPHCVTHSSMKPGTREMR